jgi:hypothetical protein
MLVYTALDNFLLFLARYHQNEISSDENDPIYKKEGTGFCQGWLSVLVVCNSNWLRVHRCGSVQDCKGNLLSQTTGTDNACQKPHIKTNGTVELQELDRKGAALPQA